MCIGLFNSPMLVCELEDVTIVFPSWIPFILLVPYQCYGHEHHLYNVWQKIQDYVIECSCCGNCYCSDKCKATDHQKKVIHHIWADFKHIYENIMKSDQTIRVVTISDLDGEIVYCGSPSRYKEFVNFKRKQKIS